MKGTAERVIPIAVAGVALVMAWIVRFVQDDAFISFIYARNLVNGEGLTWFGERVEGYTNFLWVLWTSLGLKLGIDPVAWSYAGGLLAFAATLYALWRLATLLFPERWARVVALLLFASNYTTLSYATGGLETMCQTALLALAMMFMFTMAATGTASRGRLAALSCLLAAAVLTRLDSALIGAVIGAGALWQLRRTRGAPGKILTLIGPAFVLLAAWGTWKLLYYGTLLPNTYYAKIGGEVSRYGSGLRFLFRYVHWYGLWPFIALGLAIFAVRRREGYRLLWWPAVACLLWCAYIIAIGGDFMEFRFLVPIAPYLALLLAWLLFDQLGRGLARRPLAAALVAWLILTGVSIHHARSFRGTTEDRRLDSIPALASCYGLYEEGDWSRIGHRLKASLGGTGASLALHAVGAIPYYSELATVDMWGLNDAYIARHGAEAPAHYQRPGHRRHATLSYLKARAVNFILGHPQVIPRGLLGQPGAAGHLRQWLTYVVQFNREPIGSATAVVMPLDRTSGLLMWYLTPTAAIDRVIEDEGWEQRTVQL